MQGKPPDKRQRQFLYEGLAEMLNPQEPMYKLANETDWDDLAKEFSKYYVDLCAAVSSDKADGIAAAAQAALRHRRREGGGAVDT